MTRSLRSRVLSPSPLILLLGPRASGKTTVGRLLASALGTGFVDLDDVVLAAFPEASVAETWRTHGESAWREAEARALAVALAGTGDAGVIALGGGTPMVEAARVLIGAAQREAAAVAVYLRCDAARLRERLRAQPGDRPSLTGADPGEEAERVLRDRAATYERLADVVLDCGGDDPATLVSRLEDALRRRGAAAGEPSPGSRRES